MAAGRIFMGARHPALLVDILERCLAAGLFVALCRRFYLGGPEEVGLGSVLIALSEFFVVVFIVWRKPATGLSLNRGDWAIALIGTCLPLLVVPARPLPLFPPVLCVAILLFGLCVQVASKLFLNRSFGFVPANRGVKTRGPYALVRHPIYLGYTLTHLGFLSLAPNAWNIALYALDFAFQISRIFREERILAEDPAYRRYAEAVPYRLVPGVF